MSIGAVTCVRNEAEIIEEWVAHHLAIGMTRIHVFDNQSTDDTRAKLERIHRSYSQVTVETWADTGGNPQITAFNRGLEIMNDEDIEWCAFMDADEFLANASVTSTDTLAGMLARHSTHCAIGLHWAVFGSSGHIAKPNGMIQESFLHRSDETFHVNRHIKSIVRPRYTMGCHHPHGFSLDHPYYTVSGNEISWQLPYAYTFNEPEICGWRINHYFCQWRDRWDAKIEGSKARGKHAIHRNEMHWIEHDRNEVFDPTALSWTQKDMQIMGSFLDGSHLAERWCTEEARMI